jgi:hypothetical protein
MRFSFQRRFALHLAGGVLENDRQRCLCKMLAVPPVLPVPQLLAAQCPFSVRFSAACRTMQVQLLDNEAYERHNPQLQQLSSCIETGKALLKWGTGKPASCITLPVEVGAAAATPV